MPYKKYSCMKNGMKMYCLKNIETGQVTHYKTKESRDKGIRIKEAFSHGWKPTRLRK